MKQYIQSVSQNFNKTLALSCSLIALSTFNYGFDNQGFATSQAMDAFAKRFGVWNEEDQEYELEAYFESLLNSLQYIGFAVGSKTSSRFGRRMCMFCMSCYAIVTATIVITSQSRWQILYVYIGMELSVVLVFQAEIVPASVRGMIVGTYQLSLILGGLVINSVCRATSVIQDDRAFRIPYGLFYIVPTTILSLIWFIPESPRWLLLQGRLEEAAASLTRLRAGTLSEVEIMEELEGLRLGLVSEEEKGQFVELFQGVNFKRTAIVVGTHFFQQATGQAFVSQYGTLYTKQLHSINAFDVTIITACINAVTNMFCLIMNDRIGRRPLLLAGSIVQIAGLFTMGGLGTPETITPEMKSGIVACLIVFAFGFSLGWAPLTYVVASEVPALRLRDMSQRTAGMVNIVTSFVVAFTIPYLLYTPYAALGSKVGFIFGSLAFLSLIFTYFCVPDCKGKPLEQIDSLFHQGVPVRKFKSVPCGFDGYGERGRKGVDI
ncbi:MAG: hypothetical protein M1834_004177 [Cirrosporium novae-zelandiae]|nr:MAG: hypothetical protein M1834_004177 [Cirrosporium novae-zelandiae]